MTDLTCVFCNPGNGVCIYTKLLCPYDYGQVTKPKNSCNHICTEYEREPGMPVHPFEDNNNMLWADTTGPCAVSSCTTFTNWIEINYECRICGVDCLKVMDSEFKEAYNRGDKE